MIIATRNYIGLLTKRYALVYSVDKKVYLGILKSRLSLGVVVDRRITTAIQGGIVVFRGYRQSSNI